MSLGMRRTLALVLATAAVFPAVAGPAQAAGSDRQVAAHRDDEITARVETPALFDDEAGGDADADDPAIWVHPRDRARSLVIGTAKNGGLRVYDLAGREVQAIATPEDGRFNNVDIVTGFRLGRHRTDLAVVTDRGRDQLRFYRIDPATNRLEDVTVDNPPLLFSADQAEVADQATGYGLAVHGEDAVVSRRHTTRLGFFTIRAAGDKVTYVPRSTLDLPKDYLLPNGTTWQPCGDPGEDPQVEGMVIDPRANVLYASQEDVGLWRIDLRTKERHLVERVAEFGVPTAADCTLDTENDPGYGGRIHADVEGATLYDDYLLVSSQGDSRFYVYDRRTNRPLSDFTVIDGPDADGVQHSDGAAATSTPLPGYPQGLLVLHDGENTPDDGRTSTNFKYVDWRSLGLR
jgi:3-phytase